MRHLRLIPVLLGALALCACATPSALTERPKLDFQGMGIEDLSFTTATFVAKFQVENPNRADVKIDRLSYVLKMNGEQLGQGSFDSGVEIDGQHEALVSLPIKIKYKDLVKALRAVRDKPDAPQLFALAGTVESGSFKLPFEEKGEFELPIPIKKAD